MQHLVVYSLFAGYLLDLILADPKHLPHPIVYFGKAIAAADLRLNKGRKRVAKGAAAAVSLIASVYLIFYFLHILFTDISQIAGAIFSAAALYYGLANKCLLQEGRAVIQALDDHGLDAGRRRLSHIVGRDTSELDKQQIYKATFETLSENLSDGVIAPLFYYAIAGPAGIMAYKMANTLDSMLGYKTDKYLLFGRWAAKIDDVANFIPARLTAILIALVNLSPRSAAFIFRYGRCHSSPNSGYPEAAMAGVLNCQFGGSSTYHGKEVAKPFIGSCNRELNKADFQRVRYTNHAVAAVSVIGAAATMFFIGRHLLI
jgi:adenosylcobinamide-phosphate synthase